MLCLFLCRPNVCGGQNAQCCPGWQPASVDQGLCIQRKSVICGVCMSSYCMLSPSTPIILIRYWHLCNEVNPWIQKDGCNCGEYRAMKVGSTNQGGRRQSILISNPSQLKKNRLFLTNLIEALHNFWNVSYVRFALIYRRCVEMHYTPYYNIAFHV